MQPDEPSGEVLSSHDDDSDLFDPAAPPPAPRRFRRGTAVGAGALVAALVAGVAVYTSAQSADAGAQPESVLPGTAFAMLEVDLEPASEQRSAITRMAKRFPAAGIADAAGLRDKILKSVTEDAELDHPADVEPWLGRRVGMAVFLDAGGRPKVVVAMQTTDAKAGRAALAKADDAPAVAERDGFLIAADDQATLDHALDAAEEQPLSRAPGYTSDMKQLGGTHVASGWMDSKRAVDAMLREMERDFENMGGSEGDSGESGGDESGEHDHDEDDRGSAIDPYFAALSERLRRSAVGRMAAGLHVDGDVIELRSITTGDDRPLPVGTPAAMRKLPDDTIGAAYVRDVAGIGDNSIRALGPLSEQFGGLMWFMPDQLLFGAGGTSYGEEIEPTPAEPMPAATAPPGGVAPGEQCLRSSDAPPGKDWCRPPRALSKQCQAELDKWESGDHESPPPECAFQLPPDFPTDGGTSAPLPGAPPSEECLDAIDEWKAAGAEGPMPACLDERHGVPAPGPTPAGRAVSPFLAGQDTESDDEYEDLMMMDPLQRLLSGVLGDLHKQLTGDVTVALGTLPAPGTGRAVDAAMIAQVKDEKAADAAAAKLVAQFKKSFKETPYAGTTDGVLTLSTDVGYKDRLATGNLGETDLFEQAMGELGDEVQVAVFANLERVRDAVPDYPKELAPVSAVGFSAGRDDGVGYFRLRVVVR